MTVNVSMWRYKKKEKNYGRPKKNSPSSAYRLESRFGALQNYYLEKSVDIAEISR